MFTATATNLTEPGKGGDGSTCTGGVIPPQCSISGLTDGDTYAISVVATNAVGDSASSLEVDVTVASTCGTLLAAPVCANSSFYGHDLSGVDLRGLDLHLANFQYTLLEGANFAGDDLSSANFYLADATGADFSGVNARSAQMTFTTLTNANLTGADVSSANLYGAKLTGATVGDANFSAAFLTGITIAAPLTGIARSLPTNWSQVGSYFAGPYVQLRGADLSGLDLGSADLRWADLSGVNVDGADLHAVNLTQESMNQAGSGTPAGLPSKWSFLRGYLVGPGSNVTGADFSGLDLSGLDFHDPSSWSAIRNSDFSGATMPKTAQSYSAVAMSGDNFTGDSFAGASLPGAGGPTGGRNNILTNCNFNGATINGMQSGDYSTATFVGAQIVLYSNGNFDGANFAGAQIIFGLNSSSFVGANFTGATIGRNQLGGPQKFSATSSNFTGANFTGATLHTGNTYGVWGNGFYASNLTGANFTGATFESSRTYTLGRTTLDGTVFTGATFDVALTGTTSVLGTPVNLPATWGIDAGQLTTTQPLTATDLSVAPAPQSLSLSWNLPALSTSPYVYSQANVQDVTSPGVNGDGSGCGPSAEQGSGLQSCTITGLTNGDHYLVTITTYFPDGRQFTVTDPATWVPGVGRPSAPGTPVLTDNHGSISLSWAAPSSGGGATLTYTIQEATNGGVFATVATGLTSPSSTYEGSTGGTTYAFRVKATNAAGSSAYSAYSWIQNHSVAPSAPSTPVLTDNHGSITVAWTAPSSLGGAASVTYTVQESTNGGVFATVATGLTSPSYTYPSTTAYTTYAFRVKATNAAGSSAYSAFSWVQAKP